MTIQQGLCDISNEEYHNSEGISRSGIMEFKRTPYHYWSAYLNPERPPRGKDTEATILGSAYHTLILEPTEFDKRYVIKNEKAEKLPDKPLLRHVGRDAYDAAIKAIDAARQKRDEQTAEFVRNSVGKEILSQDTYETLIAMRQKLQADPQAWALIEGGQYEKSIYWNDPHTGLLCKCRPDVLHANMVGDLKSAVDACPREFQRSLYTRGFYIQAGMICEGLRHGCDIDMRNFIYIAQEKEYPYAPAKYKLDELALEQGIAEFKNTLLKIKECHEKNEWPSYQTQIISLPTYANTGV